MMRGSTDCSGMAPAGSQWRGVLAVPNSTPGFSDACRVSLALTATLWWCCRCSGPTRRRGLGGGDLVWIGGKHSKRDPPTPPSRDSSHSRRAASRNPFHREGFFDKC